MDSEKKEFAGWWLWVLLLIVVSSIVLGATGAFGRFFGVAVEREVLVHSHQYKEARNSEVATYAAQLAGLRGQLNRSDLTESDRARINGQISSINILLQSARTK